MNHVESGSRVQGFLVATGKIYMQEKSYVLTGVGEVFAWQRGGIVIMRTFTVGKTWHVRQKNSRQ